MSNPTTHTVPDDLRDPPRPIKISIVTGGIRQNLGPTQTIGCRSCHAVEGPLGLLELYGRMTAGLHRSPTSVGTDSANPYRCAAPGVIVGFGNTLLRLTGTFGFRARLGSDPPAGWPVSTHGGNYAWAHLPSRSDRRDPGCPFVFRFALSARAQRICHVTDLWNGSGRH